MSEFFQGLMRHLNSESDLIIDLSEVAMTSEAVASIVRLNKKAKVNRFRLPRFVMPSDGPTRQIFEVTRLDRVFQVYTTIDAALASLR